MQNGPVCALPQGGGDGGGPPGGGNPEEIAKMLQRAAEIGAVDQGHLQGRMGKVWVPHPRQEGAAAEEAAGHRGVAFPPPPVEVIEEVNTGGGAWPDDWTDNGRTPF